MSNVYRVNITCPRCQFVGDVEADFPCGHEDVITALVTALNRTMAVLNAKSREAGCCADRGCAAHFSEKHSESCVLEAARSAIAKAVGK